MRRSGGKVQLGDFESKRLLLLTGNGNRKKLPSLGTTTLEYGLAVFSLHAGAETMGTLATDFAGLISSFRHGSNSYVKYATRKMVKDVLLTITKN